MERFKDIAGVVIWILIAFSAGWFGSQFPPGQWYDTLVKPAWNPPGWVFGPVWTLLYFLMGLSAWLIWRQGGLQSNLLPLGVFMLQLVLNALWSWLFFGQQLIGVAFIELILLIAAIVATIILFWPRNMTAALLLAPYLLWTLYASTLNGALWWINR